MGRTRSGNRATPNRPSPTSRSPAAGTRLPAPRRRSRPIATSTRTTARTRPAMRRRLIGMPGQCSAAGPPRRHLSEALGGGRVGRVGRLGRVGFGRSRCIAGGRFLDRERLPGVRGCPRSLGQGQPDADDRERHGAHPHEQERIVERRGDDVAEEPGEDARPEPAGNLRERPGRSRPMNAMPDQPDDRRPPRRTAGATRCAASPGAGSPKLWPELPCTRGTPAR